MKPDLSQLTEPQFAVLRVIWDRGTATVPEVWRALHDDRGLAQSTVATVMGRLEKRGVLKRRTRRGGEDVPGAGQFEYRVVATEAEVRRAMVEGLTSMLFGGKAYGLVSHLVESRQLRAADLEKARDLLRRAGADSREPREREDNGGR